MSAETWRDRLERALMEDGRSMRAVSIAAGVGAGYLHGVLKDGKEPGIERLAKVAAELRVSLSYILVGVHVSTETARIVRALEEDPDRRDAILRLLRPQD